MSYFFCPATTFDEQAQKPIAYVEKNLPDALAANLDNHVMIKVPKLPERTKSSKKALKKSKHNTEDAVQSLQEAQLFLEENPDIAFYYYMVVFPADHVLDNRILSSDDNRNIELDMEILSFSYGKNIDEKLECKAADYRWRIALVDGTRRYKSVKKPPKLNLADAFADVESDSDSSEDE